MTASCGSDLVLVSLSNHKVSEYIPLCPKSTACDTECIGFVCVGVCTCMCRHRVEEFSCCVCVCVERVEEFTVCGCAGTHVCVCL